MTRSPEVNVLSAYRATESRVPSAFHSGGFKKGSGGEIELIEAESLFAPSTARTLTGALLTTDAYPSPDACAKCHTEIHDNWQASMHAVSATDDWYLRVKDFLAFEQGEAEVRLCAGCHAPVALATGEVGLYNRESAASEQGVSCIFCHTLESVGTKNGEWVSDPGRVRTYKGGDYLAADETENAAHLVMAAPGVHKADMTRSFYQSSEVCASCHQFELNGVKLQSTYEEWENSSYAEQGIGCQDCHFTLGAGATIPDPGKLVSAYPEHEHIYRHTLTGGSTVAVSDRNLDNLRDAVSLEASLSDKELSVTVYNRLAGHHIPTGVADMRQLWLEVTAMDDTGNTVYSSGVLDAAGYLPKDATVFHQVLGNAHGGQIELHDIWNATEILEDTRIPANGSHTATFAVPDNALDISVRLLWRDAPAAFVSRVLNTNANNLPIAELATWHAAIQ